MWKKAAAMLMLDRERQDDAGKADGHLDDAERADSCMCSHVPTLIFLSGEWIGPKSEISIKD
jgi:hypothetical protein